MRVDIFQAVAICYRGNAFLRSESHDRAPELMGPSDLFRHIQELTFKRESGLPIQHCCLAMGTKSFFLRMLREGVDEFRLALDLCLRGGLAQTPIGWGIVASSDHGTEIWQPAWTGVLVRYNEPSAYRVAYRSAKHSPWAIRRPEPMDVAASRLRGLIHETLQTCIHLELAPLFDQIRNAWRTEGQGRELAEDILGPEAADPIRQLAQMAIECVLLMEGKPWQEMLTTLGEEKTLAHTTDRLWSASMRALESICAKSPPLPFPRSEDNPSIAFGH